MTKEDLKTERSRREYTQEQMAKFLADTPISTYRKWEQGINEVPPWVGMILNPRKTVLPGLSLDEVIELDVAARAKGVTMDDLIGDFIRRGLKGLIALMLIGVIGYQVSHPNDLTARRVGRRRTEGDAIGLVAEEA